MKILTAAIVVASLTWIDSVEANPLKQSPTRALMQSQQNLVKASLKQQNEIAQVSDKIYAEIVQSSYQKITKSKRQYGQWKGVIKGNGEVHMALIISRNGKVELNRYMGKVILQKNQTIFNFITSPPQGSNWSWKILTSAR